MMERREAPNDRWKAVLEKIATAARDLFAFFFLLEVESFKQMHHMINSSLPYCLSNGLLQ